MNPCLDGPDSGFFSANFSPEREENNENDSGNNEKDKLQSQLECLKIFLKTQTEELRAQQELTKDLEEELEATKLSLTALQEKCEIQNRRRNSPTISSFSDPGLSWRYGNLHSAVNKVEETLRNLSKKHSCGLSDCKVVIEEEIEKIISVKKDLKFFEKCKSKNQFSGSNNPCSSQQIMDIDSVGNFDLTDSCQDSQISRCNLLHLKDVETFREKSVTGVAILEEMKEQIDILENLVRKYVDSFPCGCDKNTFFACEEKLECLRGDFNDITDQLCSFLQKCNISYDLDESINESSLLTCYDLMRVKGQRSVDPDDEFLNESVSELRSDYQRLQKEICDLENEIEKLQQYSKQLDEELEGKQVRLSQQNKDLDSRMGEIEKVKDLMEKITLRLQKTRNEVSDDLPGKSEIVSSSSSSNNNGSSLRSLFSTMHDFCCVLEKTKEILFEAPRLKEENEKLKEKLCSLEKCICNKEKTLKVLQDTVRVRECQIQEIKSKIETSENETSKLTQDVEEKCRLIASLQEALRKCKQFQVHVRSAQLESMEFKICELDNRLKESEKEALAKEKTMENLRSKILTLSLKNFALTQEINIIEPRLKSMYKNCHTFEKMVNDLQAELNVRECEVDGLCGKIKELEEELDCEFRKCESRALEDSKCIEELCAAVKNFQSELCSARENCNKTIVEAEERLLKEQEMNAEKECEFREEIRQLNMEIECLRNQLQESVRNEHNSCRISDLEDVVKEAESRRSSYDKKISEMQNLLECTMLEHEEERKNILQKLCEEKKENVRNKTLITKLNENMKRKILNEKSLKESIKRFAEDAEILRKENQELKTEVEVRKKIMNSMEKNENANLTELEDLLGQVKLQKADVKSRCCDLRAELDKEVKVKRLLECRVEDLNAMLESKLHEFDEMVQNYKCTSSKLQQTLVKLKQAEEKSCCVEKRLRQELDSCHEMSENECLKKIIDMKTAENGKLFSQLLVAKVEMESLQTEYFATLADKDCLISRLKYEGSCFEKNFEDILGEYLKLEEDNKRIQEELNCSSGKISDMQSEFREKQKDLCSKLRSTMVEKNELLNSVDKLQKQLEHICLENVNKDEMNRELAKECSRLKINSDASDKNLKKKSDKIICNLNKEVNSLQCELSALKENYNSLNEEYQNALEQLSLMEKKKSNLEKLYLEVNNECGELQELKMRMEKELCEIKSQNMILKDKISSATKAESSCSSDDKNLRNKLRELTMKIKTLEGSVIPELEQEISEKNYCIQNLKGELREANISSQRMRNEALRVIQHTKKYLAAQRCANETLKSRLECSNKRGNILGAENRDLEEQLKAVTRMNEFLLRQFESSKNDVNEVENNSFSPLPWGCATVERDTSSSEYLAESGIQSMQQSPTNLDCNTCDCKHQEPCKWNNSKRNKHCGSAEYTTCRNNIR